MKDKFYNMTSNNLTVIIAYEDKDGAITSKNFEHLEDLAAAKKLTDRYLTDPDIKLLSLAVTTVPLRTGPMQQRQAAPANGY